MKKVIWEVEEVQNYLIDHEEIEESIPFGDEAIVVELENSNMDDLMINGKFAEYKEKEDTPDGWYNVDELQEFFESIGINAEVHDAPEYGDPVEFADKLIYDINANEFGYGEYWPIVKTYEWHDGSNWKTVELGEGCTEYEMEVAETEVSLDEWNGHDMETDGTGLHEYIQKINKLDGEKVDDRYLLVKWSQWQGSHPSGEILTIDEVKDHLEELDRDVNEYMEAISERLGE